MTLQPAIVNLVKRVLYLYGEPYSFKNKKLHFSVGSRPVRMKYIDSDNDIVRNDVLQIQYFQKNIKDNDVLWDIGSHHGHYSIFAASLVNGNNQVFSFEPDAAARAVQRKNIDLNKFGQKIKLFDFAMSGSDGDIFFNSQGGNANSHIIKNISNLNRGKVVTIRGRSIDSLLLELPKPTFVKIDTEGAEIDILKGAANLLAMKDVTFICELHPFAWPQFGVQFSDFTSILSKSDRCIELLDHKKSFDQLPYYGTVLF